MSSDEYAFWERKLLGSFDWFDLEYLKYEAFSAGERVRRGTVPMTLNEIRDVLGLPHSGGRGNPWLVGALRELTRAPKPVRTTITFSDGRRRCGRFWLMPAPLDKK